MISAQTTTRYIDLLADLLLVGLLRPFHRNLGKRIVKAPKVYVRDSGIVHALLGFPISTHSPGTRSLEQAGRGLLSRI